MAEAVPPDPTGTPDGEHPRVTLLLAEAMGETMGAIGEADKGHNAQALDSIGRALTRTEEALRLQRNFRSVVEQRLKPNGTLS